MRRDPENEAPPPPPPGEAGFKGVSFDAASLAGETLAGGTLAGEGEEGGGGSERGREEERRRLSMAGLEEEGVEGVEGPREEGEEGARIEVSRAAVAKVILRCVGGAAESSRSEDSHTPGAVFAAEREEGVVAGDEVAGRDDAAPSGAFPFLLSPRMCCNVLLRLCLHLYRDARTAFIEGASGNPPCRGFAEKTSCPLGRRNNLPAGLPVATTPPDRGSIAKEPPLVELSSSSPVLHESMEVRLVEDLLSLSTRPPRRHDPPA